MKVIGVAWAGTDTSYADFIGRHGLTFPSIDDTAGDVFSRYGVASQPAWVFLRDGEHRTVRGTMSEDELRAAVAGT